MKKTWIGIILGCAALVGQTAQPEAGPLSDKQRLEIARMQRDLLLADSKMKEAVERFNAAKAEAETLQRALAGKVAEAAKACGEQKVFDPGALACVEKNASPVTR